MQIPNVRDLVPKSDESEPETDDDNTSQAASVATKSSQLPKKTPWFDYARSAQTQVRTNNTKINTLKDSLTGTKVAMLEVLAVQDSLSQLQKHCTHIEARTFFVCLRLFEIETSEPLSAINKTKT